MNHPLFSSAVFVALFTFCMPILAQEAVPAGSSAAPPHSVSDVVERYPAGSIKTVEQAEQALVDVKQQRAQIEARFSEEGAACHSKFFMTSCTDAVKERRRAALAQLNPVEVEANAFKRRARVEQRDKALAGQQAKEDERALKRADSSRNKEDAQALPNPHKDDSAKTEDASANGNSESAKKINEDRVARHKAEMEKEQAKEASQADKRAENIRNYEKKVQKSQERQREIAERKAKKELERSGKVSETP